MKSFFFRPIVRVYALVILGIILGATGMWLLFQAVSTPTPISPSPLQPSSLVSPLPSGWEAKITVKKVIDGDTIELSTGERLRYIGIDTPETVDPRKPVQCFGKEAAERNKQLVLGKTVKLEKDISQTDRYGRLLRYIYLINEAGNEIMVNEVLVREGFAFASTFPPDVKYQTRFQEAEKEARANNRGLWASCPISGGTVESASTTVIESSSETQIKLQEEIKVESTHTGCVIKGNISSGGKIYHLPGCGSYDKTAIDESAGEHWFCSEEEAIKAGWRKAKNC